MADTIARLIFEANTAQLKKANEELKKLAKESGKAAKAIKDEGTQKKKTNTETKKGTDATGKDTKGKKDNTKETKKATTANEKLAKSFKNAATATATLQGPLNGVSGRLSFIATGLARIGPLGLIASAGFAAFGFALKSALDTFSEFEAQVLQLEQMLETTGHRVGLTSQELQDLATEVGIATLASAGDIRQAEGILLTFGSIAGDQFKRTTVLAQDLAQVMGITAASAAKTLGKAIEDPVNNLTSLSRAGVIFTATERDMIDGMLLASDKMAAQDFIIKKLEASLGGAGAGAGKGLAGAFDGLAEQADLLRIAFIQESGFASFIADRTNEATALLAKITEKVKTSNIFTGAMSDADLLELSIKRAEEQMESLLETYGNAAFSNPAFTQAEEQFKRLKAQLQELQDPQLLQPLFGGQSVADMAGLTTPATEQPLSGVALLTSGQTPTPAGTGTVLKPQPSAPAAEEAPVAFDKLPSILETNNAIMASELQVLEMQKANADSETLLFEQIIEKRTEHATAVAALEFQRKLSEVEADDIYREEKIAKLQEEHAVKMDILSEQNQATEQEELRHKAKLGDIDAKAALAKQKFEKLTGIAQTKQITSTLAQRTAAMAGMGKGMFRISQMAAAADTAVNTYKAVQLARATYAANPPLAAAMAGVELAFGMAQLAKIKAQKFGGGSVSSGGAGGGGGGGAAAAASAPIQAEPMDEVMAAPQPINVTVDGSIDPTGARRIIEAINEATEDGLEINALVGT